MEDRCVSCGKVVPEGRQICFACERGYTEVLTIDEIIGHCKRQVQRFDDCYGYGFFETAPLESNATKEYWEHKQVAAYLEELKSYREAKVHQTNEDVRLIDARKLILDMEEKAKQPEMNVPSYDEFRRGFKFAMEFVKRAPTAFNAEKVVEQLMVVHDEGWCPGDDLECVLDKACRDCYREKITEIIKKGGAEQ